MPVRDQPLAEQLSQSQIVRDYEQAFAEATGMTLKFEPGGRKRAMLRGGSKANAFCQMMAECAPGCQMCVEMQGRLQDEAAAGTVSAICRAGLTDSVVPVKAGETILGFLTTGQISQRPLRVGTFEKIVDWLREGGVVMDWAALKSAYLKTRVVGHVQHAAVLRLLEVFAAHLSLAAERIATKEAHAESPLVTRARKYIDDHQSEDITLAEVAKATHVSTFHFCKMFKRATGLTFTNYLTLVRIARAKESLANPQKRISEIAFEVGFGSLTQFNRVFRRHVGKSPTAFRESGN